jgi:methylenetetrahydrofolate dehydrogenase (NAD+)
VVNRSEIVGRPLAALLANDGAKVYSVDITGVQQYHRGAGIKLRKHQVQDTTLKLEDVAPLSDIIITGVPSSSYKFPSELIRDGAICINFSSDKNFDNAGVKERAGIYVPAIGKVTIAMLLRNLYWASSYFELMVDYDYMITDKKMNSWRRFKVASDH